MFELIPKHEKRAENTTRRGVLLRGVWKFQWPNIVFTVFYTDIYIFSVEIKSSREDQRENGEVKSYKINANFKTSDV